jgi:hypothetical protein
MIFILWEIIPLLFHKTTLADNVVVSSTNNIHPSDHVMNPELPTCCVSEMLPKKIPPYHT